MSNPIVHFDLSGPDEGALHRFYGELLGWEVDAKGPGYALVRTPEGGPDGAIVESEGPSLALGVAVDDLDAAVAEALRLGGELLSGPVDNGWVKKALLRDPAGNKVSLIEK
jgi:predicted enzyme related to lactoylglutathione lyase